MISELAGCSTTLLQRLLKSVPSTLEKLGLKNPLEDSSSILPKMEASRIRLHSSLLERRDGMTTLNSRLELTSLMSSLLTVQLSTRSTIT